MHVKEHVKEFVHDVKRKFSSKHNRGSTCSTCCKDMHDCASSYSSSDNTDYSSSASSLPTTPKRKRLTSFLHRSPSSHSKQVDHRLARVGSKRYRLFSAPSVPSMHAAHSTATESTVHVCEQHATHQSATPGSSQEDYPDVIDVSAHSAITDSTAEDYVFRDSASQSRSDTSGTLTMISADFKKSISDSDSPFDSIHLQSDDNSAPLISITPPALDSDVPPSMSESEQPPAAADDEEITLVQPISSSSPVSVLPSPSSPVPQASRPQPPRSTPASPAPLYIPRLTVPSMFLPIPNVRLFPLSHPLVWWLAPSRSGSLPSVSTFLPRSGNRSPRPRPYPTFMFPLQPTILPPPRSRHQ